MPVPKTTATAIAVLQLLLWTFGCLDAASLTTA
jgi:hypothetical protein